MTDAVPRKNEPSLEQEQRGSGNLTSSNHLGHHCPQAHPIGLAAVQTHRQTSAEQTRQRELEILEELKRLGKSCQSDVKPSISAVRATLEEIARKLMMAHYKGASTEAARAMHILKKREKAKEELEEKKKKIESDVKLSIIDTKFSTQVESVEAQLKSSTVGLVTLDQMRQKQESAIKEREKQLAQKLDSESSTSKLRIEKQEKDGESSRTTKSLSFYDDDDDEDDDDKDQDDENKCDNSSDRRPDSNGNDDDANSNHSNGSRKKRAKIAVAWDNLGVDTSYLPDREREEEERKFREKLATEWRESQQRLKGEEIEITFSYWDGSGHRRQVRMKKGDSIYQFLQACLDTLRKDFNELRSVSADQLMYVKEDLIIPHHYTFYDFIVTKARGKSGPLFMFDVHEDVRLTADATVEKDESHAGKVIMRSWYERNKHIFPASRWESYDPTKSYDKYTISDKRSR